MIEVKYLRGDSNYGHRFTWKDKIAVTLYGTGTYHLAKEFLPYKTLDWRLEDAGPHYGKENYNASKKRKAEAISQLEVRAPLGKETSLRQQGKIAKAKAAEEEVKNG